MNFIIGASAGFALGWLFFKRPELVERFGNWIWIKIKALWHKVF